MDHRETVLILLACYNGSEFICQQIESIQHQDYEDWVLWVRDDGSTDNTINIVRNFAETDKRIRLFVNNNNSKRGPAKNFEALMLLADKENIKYFMFSDQDDVWRKNKLFLMVEKIKKIENQSSSLEPILIHSDLEVVDSSLNTINKSFFVYQGINHEPINSVRILLPQNFVTGCAVIFNKSLLSLALPVPSEVIMHDWWLSLLASSAGRLEYVDQALVKYRQHSSNEVGAKPIFSSLFSFKDGWKGRLRRGEKHFVEGISQARQLIKRIEERSIPISRDVENCIAFYSNISEIERFDRIRHVFELRMGPQNKLRKLLFCLRLLRFPASPPKGGKR